MKVITIVGGSGSGKGFLAKHIIKTLGEESVSVIPHDMYYYPWDRFPEHLHFDFMGEDFRNFDHPEALETSLLVEHIRQLKYGKSVQIPNYDFGNNPDKKWKRTDGEKIESRDFLIIDGIFSLENAEIRELTDVAVFIDVSPVNQMARRFMRDWGRGQARSDMGQEGMWDDILFYIHHVRTGYDEYVAPYKKYADLVVENDTWVEEGETPKMVDVSVNYLKGKFGIEK